MDAYQKAFEKTGTEIAPWHVVPAIRSGSPGSPSSSCSWTRWRAQASVARAGTRRRDGTGAGAALLAGPAQPSWPAVPGRREPLAGTLEPLLAALCEGFPTLPEGQGFLEAGAAGLELAHHAHELFAGLFVAQSVEVVSGAGVAVFSVAMLCSFSGSRGGPSVRGPGRGCRFVRSVSVVWGRRCLGGAPVSLRRRAGRRWTGP